MATAIERLSLAWSRPPGFVGWLMAVNHRAVGLRYVVTGFVFFLLAGLQALVMRLQLAQPELEILSPTAFNQFFTMHGTTMMFLFAVPILEGIAIYVVPLMIGARDMAFPRLNAFGYWIYLIAGVMLYAAFFTGSAPDAGWFNYVTLTGPGFSPHIAIDYWVIPVTLLEVAALVAAVELIVTILKQRAPGMSINRMSLLTWAALVTSFMVVFAMPPLVLTSIFLEMDRKIGTHFFNPAAGGDPLLWQHLFWIFGHPDVYIMQLPAFGIISVLLPVLVGRRIAGYTLIILSIVAIAFLSFGLWVHHMYAAGLALMGLHFFGAASMMIAIPSGVAIFAWIVTIWGGRLTLNAPMLFVIGSIVVFTIGGMTGVMIASPTFDAKVHDSYFIVAHFHYVLIGGVVFPIFAGLHYWFPKAIGRLLDDRLGQLSFWLMFVGFNASFFPMHILGFQGMPRRVYTYLSGLGLDEMNLLATVGAFVLGLGAAVFVWNAFRSLLLGPVAGDNPWNADTLEWATASPPPPYNFALIPMVQSRNPLWDQPQLQPLPEEAPWGWVDLADTPALQRETYVTSVLDAQPEGKAVLPAPSILPLWLALAVTTIFLGVLSGFLVFLAGILLTVLVMLIWLWPKKDDWALPRAEELLS